MAAAAVLHEDPSDPQVAGALPSCEERVQDIQEAGDHTSFRPFQAEEHHGASPVQA